MMLAAGEVLADTYVNGYTRNNGTYVAPHMRSSPDNSYNNNWSTSPNTNPYTGRQGTNAPTYNDRSPSQNNNSYGSPLLGGQNRGSTLGNPYGR